MQTATTTLAASTLSTLLRGEAVTLRRWTEDWNAGRLVQCLTVVVAGAGFYGAAMGCWRAPLQAWYVALKFPLIILLTTCGNALLHAMLAPLMGLNLRFRQSFLAVLMSFAITAAILGSFSPLVAYLVWNAPPMAGQGTSRGAYSFILLTHVAAIAFAGLVGNLRLAQLLRELSGSAAVARRVLLAWLACNLLLGSQLCWILRPFIGAPDLPVEFVRGAAFKGNFYEAVFRAGWQLLHSN